MTFFIKTNATIMLSPDISLSDHVSTLVGPARCWDIEQTT